MSTRARVVQMEPPAATGGNALLVLVGLSVMFLLIVALLGAAKTGGSLYQREQSAVCGTHFLRWRGRSLHGIRSNRNSALCEICLGGDCHRTSRQYAGSRAPLVSFRTASLRQHLRDVAELCVDGGRR